jgi:putative ABC transport system permease protein
MAAAPAPEPRVSRLAWSAALALYRRAVRRVAGALPAGSEDEQVAVFDALQREAYREGGWRALLRAWVAEFGTTARLRFASDSSSPAEGGPGATAWVASIGHDIRDAVRSLRRSPGYTAVVIAMFALGIGVNTAVFSLVDAVLFKALPFARADRLVLLAEWPVHTQGKAGNWTVAPTVFAHWRQQTQSLTDLEASLPQNFALRNEEVAEDVVGARVTTGYFDLLGVPVARGRSFSGADAATEAPCVAVVTDRLWQRRLGRDPAALGRPLHLSGALCTLVGVLPADSVFDRGAPEVYIPLVLTPAEAHSEGRQLTVLARLRDEATVAQASAELAGLATSFNTTRGSAGLNWTAVAFPWRDILVRTDARQLVWILMAAVVGVLTIACANVAGLSLSRTILRQREIAVRAAMGAGRGRLMRALVTESLVLAVIGGIVALIVGSLTLRAFIALVPPGTLPSAVVPALDGRALFFTTAASVLTGVIAGLLPAWQAGRVTLTEALATTGRGFTASRRTSWMQSALLVAELALAMVLVTGSALLTMSLVKLAGVSPGFEAANVLTLRLSPAGARYATDPALEGFYTRARASIAAIPNVEKVGAVTSLPLGGWLYGSPFTVLGVAGPDRPPSAHLQSVTAGYFESLRIHLAAGRTFTDTDDVRAPGVAIVNETLVRRFILDGRAVGRYLTVASTPAPVGTPWQIVGVIDDVKTGGLADPDLATPEVYLPHAQAPMPVMFFAIRARTPDPMALVPDVRAALHAVDPDVPVGSVMTMDERIGASLRAVRFRTAVIGGFAALAALLACLGAYAVRSRAVAARRREMGIRVALGATRGQIIRLALAQAAGLAAAGLGLGLTVAWTLTGYLGAWLFETRASDPTIVLGAVVCLGGAVLVASWVPARRAGTVDPLTVLRDS